MRTKLNKHYSKGILKKFFLLTVLSLGLSPLAKAQQLMECDTTVPFFVVDLSSNPDSIYTTPEIIRNGQCCNGPNNENYVSFYVTLHPSVAMIEIGIAPGYADPQGSGFYNIIPGDTTTLDPCGMEYAGGSETCIVGTGPHKITYHKPGSNKVKYYIKQIPQPIYPMDDSTRVGCTLPLEVFGLDSVEITTVDYSTSGGSPVIGQYDGLIHCTATDCAEFYFEPEAGTPDWVDYQICGVQQASTTCGVWQSCDTIRIYKFDALTLSASPNPAEFCIGDSVTVTASGTGGAGTYGFSWYDNLSALVSSDSTYTADMQGDYDVYLADDLVSPTCPVASTTVTVIEGAIPIVSAGSDTTVCATSPVASVHGYSSTDSLYWSGGLGSFGNINNPNTTYTPDASEITAGSVELYVTSIITGGGCVPVTDTVVVYFSDTVYANPSFAPIQCNGELTTVFANATGGIGQYTYLWTTGGINSQITVPAGTYGVIVKDSIGCESSLTYAYVTEPAPLVLQMYSSDESVDGACDGTAWVDVAGGTGPYTYLWDNLETNDTTTNTLCWGVHTVDVTDANLCTIYGSVVVNKPSCSSFEVSATNTDVSCYGDTNAVAIASATGGTGPYVYSWNTTPPQNTATANNLGAGTYTVTAMDTVNNCIDVMSLTVFQPTILTNTMSHTDVTTLGGNDGSATANPLGGTPTYTYSWFPAPASPQTTQTATNLTSGVYYVNILDANSCLITDSVNINEPPCNDFIVSVSIKNSSCNGADNGSAYLVISQGNPPYSISWSSGETDTMNVYNLAAGTYSVTVDDSKGCSTFTTFSITEPDSLQIGLAPTDVTCYGQNNGTIDLSVSGGVFPYSYEWYKGATNISENEDLINLGQGTYSVIVTDANGCTISGFVGVDQPAVLAADYLYTDALCNNSDDGTIDATITGGVTPYSYSWTGPSGYTNTTQDLSGLAPGLYTLQVTDANGCMLKNQMEAYINEPDAVVIEQYSVPCPVPGATSVIVTIDSISGGTGGPYSVNYGSGYGSPGVYSAILDIDSAYQVTAMDGNGCTTPDTTDIVIDPSVVIDSVTFDPCVGVGVTDINITVYASGGDGGSYEVSTDGGSNWNAPGTYTILLPVATSYNIVVRDSSTCESLVWPITIPDVFDDTLVLTAEASCPGATDGSIDLSVSGGTSPYTYSWTGPASYSASTQDISGLEAGWYYVAITDDSSCVIMDSIEVTTTPDVTPPSFISCGAGAQNEVADNGVCYYTNTGTAWDATATDNCAIDSVYYTLSGATTGTGLSLDGIQFGLGTTLVLWTAVDGSGNTSTCQYNVVVDDDQDPAISSCGASGTQNVVADNGLCTYTNSGTGWDATATDNCTVSTLEYNLTGATTGSGTTLDGVVFGLGTTTVTWTVTDQSGNTDNCTFDVVVTDDQDPSILTCGPGGNQNEVVDNGSCTYTHSGTGWNATADDNCSISTIYYTLSGATTGVGSTLDGISFNLGTTTVTWTAVDGSGNQDVCTFDVIVTDDQLPAITNCGPSGDQTVNANLGTCTYTYSGTGWNATATDNCTVSTITYTLTGATTGTGSSLNGVSFNLGVTLVTWTVTDGSGNTVTCSFTVTVLDDQDPAISSCGASGNQNVSTDVGVCTYTQAGTGWDATATDNCSISSLTYTLTGATTGSGSSLDGVTFNQGVTTVTWTVTDGSGNTDDCTFNVTVTDTEVPAISNCVGDITANNDNGSCGKVVTWTPPTFTDNCGATMTSTHNPGDFFPIGTTTVTYTVTDGSENVSTCVFDVTIIDAQLPQMTCQADIESCTPLVTFTAPSASDNCGVASVTQIAGLSSGSLFPVGTTTITYEAIDIHGNSSTCSFDVIIHPIPVLSTVSTDISCFSFGDGAIDLTVTTGTSPYNYNWSNGATTQDINNLEAGIYSVTVTDIFGCSASTSDTINEPAQLSLSKQVDHVNCYGGNDGAIDLTITGGITPYNYDWSNGATTEDLTGLTIGAYTVDVTDANGCLVTNTTVIVQPDSLEIQTAVTVATCNASNGSIQTQVIGGTTPFTYLWSNGSTNSNLTNVASGNYSLTVTDANGCILTYSDSVGMVNTLNAQVYLDDVLCYGDSTGQAIIDVETGTPPYTYVWSNGDTGNKADELSAGSYTVMVTDAFGCVFGYDFVIDEPDSLWVVATPYVYGYDDSGMPYNVSANGANNGSVDAEAGGGVPPYSYTWGEYGSGQYIYNLGAGSYEVLVIDDNGCIATDAVRLIQPGILEMPEGVTPNSDGDNDYFVVHGLYAYPDNDITIYNRWGNVVYQKNGYDNDWAGENKNGEALPEGTYYVILNVYSGGGTITLTGYVDLRR